MPQLKNERQEKFALAYSIEPNGTKAAKEAGYKEQYADRNAKKLMKNPDVIARIDELNKDQMERLHLTADWVTAKLVETYVKCSEPEPILEWDYKVHDKVPNGTYKFDSKGALKALELLGRKLGMFTDDKMQQALQNKLDVNIEIVGNEQPEQPAEVEQVEPAVSAQLEEAESEGDE